jgi:GntR family transcriptional regulator
MFTNSGSAQRLDFSAAVREALAGARERAVRLGSAVVEPAHQFAGLLQTGDPSLAQLLERLGADATDLLAAAGSTLPPPGAPGASPRAATPPYSEGGKRVLEQAMAEARDARRQDVGPDHLLLALMEEDGAIAELCGRFGITPDAVRREGPSLAGALPAVPDLGVRIDDRSDRSIYEQIVQQVRERAAAGLISPGWRMPTVRQLAERLDVAPGTVARAYSELERLGVVVTQGARGTRVAERKQAAEEGDGRRELFVGLLRPVALAAFQLGATAEELHRALGEAIRGMQEWARPDEGGGRGGQGG